MSFDELCNELRKYGVDFDADELRECGGKA
jgi:hypothetical protein